MRLIFCGLCDPYQPLEAKYEVTRNCLEILADNNWPVVIQTRSSLVLRDLDILKGAEKFEVGLTVTTADDEIRKLFEPNAPSIKERLNALDELHQSGIKTYAMIAPILPGAGALANALAGKVDYIIVDRMNYHYADWIYRKYSLEDRLSDDFFQKTSHEIANTCKKSGIACNLTF